MVAANLDLTGDLILEQGSGWELKFQIPGNVTNAYFRGQIKQTFGGDLLTEFRFASQWDSETDKTTVAITLTAGQIQKLPIPPEEQFWRYDIKMQIPGKEPKRLIQGKVAISPGITI